MTSTGLEDLRTAKVDGATLAYREQGEGEPVLFIHGGVSDLRIWANQLPVVGRSYRAISYSRRYSRPNEDIDPDARYDFIISGLPFASLPKELQEMLIAAVKWHSWDQWSAIHEADRLHYRKFAEAGTEIITPLRAKFGHIRGFPDAEPSGSGYAG